MIKLCKDCASENVCGITHTTEDIACNEYFKEIIGRCKDCDKWKQGKTETNKDWCSNEGFCSNWRTITGKDFYCGDFEVKGGNT